jgi:hypothetical protein
MIGNLPVGADGNRVALVATTRGRYALPGGEHGATFQQHEKGYQHQGILHEVVSNNGFVQ